MGMGGGLDLRGPKVIFRIAGIPFSETIVNTWIVMLLLIIASHLLTRRLELIPRGSQHFTELIVGSLEGLVRDTMGEKLVGFTPFFGTLALFIGGCNLVGLTGLRPPTADLNTTLGLALMIFVINHYYAIKTKGLWPYLKGYADPMIVFLPLNITGELSKPISLSFRLFGNLLGGLVILALVYYYAAPIVPIVFHVYFDLFSGLLQTFIFLMLSMVFISMSMAE